MDQPGKVAHLARGELNRENEDVAVQSPASVYTVAVSHIQRIGCQPERTTLHGGQSRSCINVLAVVLKSEIFEIRSRKVQVLLCTVPVQVQVSLSL